MQKLSFDLVAQQYSVSLEDMVLQGTITKQEARLLEEGDSQAIRLSTLEALCTAIGCKASEFFVELADV